MSELTAKYQYAPTEPVKTTVEKSVEREGAFSKPGTTSKSASKGKSWKPATGTRFRATNEKARGRPRKHARDKRSIQFF